MRIIVCWKRGFPGELLKIFVELMTISKDMLLLMVLSEQLTEQRGVESLESRDPTHENL